MLVPDPRLVSIFETLKEREGVDYGKALQSIGLMVHGKLFAFIKDDRLVVKLPASSVNDLVAHHGAVRFEKGQGKPLREWVSLHDGTGIDWSLWALHAADFVGKDSRRT